MEGSVERERLVSVGGTLLGYGLLALGVAMVGVTAYELLFASGRTLASAQASPRAVVGLALGAAGYLVLRYTLDRDADVDEPDVEPSEASAADAYQFDT
ncbi:hypothetical protein [Halosimplex sp. TS25]|uniref:hypothetical protein n=1 Tax=Halosimplex rarum TaxID=3396619 RepID=UPI0039ECBF61